MREPRCCCQRVDQRARSIHNPSQPVGRVICFLLCDMIHECITYVKSTVVEHVHVAYAICAQNARRELPVSGIEPRKFRAHESIVLIVRPQMKTPVGVLIAPGSTPQGLLLPQRFILPGLVNYLRYLTRCRRVKPRV